jgi:cell wall-associated NlpC family hydrolase
MNFTPYVGLPWQDRGCWELLRKFYVEQLGIALPSYVAEYTPEDPHQAAELILAEARAWHQVQPGSERPGDAALFTVAGEPTHVGVVVEPGRFLHIRIGQTSVVERYDGPLWGRRLRGFYRHAEAA